MPGEGVEPSRAEAHGILSPARLPVPPSRRGPRLPIRPRVPACVATRTDMSRRPSTAAVLVALVATLASACTGGAGEPSTAPDPVPVKIAFLHDMSVPGSAQTVAPALLGLQLALQEAVDRGDLPVVPEVVGLDVEGDESKASALAQSVVDDPSFVAAVIGPFWSEPTSVGALLDGAGVPTLSVSELGSSLASQGWSSWRRVVAGLPGESAALAAAIRVSTRSAGGTCLVGDGSSFSDELGGLLSADLGTTESRRRTFFRTKTPWRVSCERVDGSGCGVRGVDGIRARAHRCCGPGLTEGRLGLDPAVRLVGDEDRVVPLDDGGRR